MQQVPDLLGRDPGEQGAPLAPMGASSSTRSQGQVKEFEGSVEAVMKRFASGLQRVLEDVVRYCPHLSQSQLVLQTESSILHRALLASHRRSRC